MDAWIELTSKSEVEPNGCMFVDADVLQSSHGAAYVVAAEYRSPRRYPSPGPKARNVTARPVNSPKYKEVL